MARDRPSVPRWARTLLLAGIGLLALEAAYLLGARWWLGSEGLTKRLNRRPERLQLLWSTATSPWPGLLRARGVELRVQTGAVQWWMTADEAWATVDLFALARRQLRFTTLRARGVALRLRRRPRTPEEAVERAALVPEIPGFNFTLRPPPSLPAVRLRPWRLHFEGVELTDATELWIDEYRLRGRLAAAGRFEVQLGRSTEVSDALITVTAGRLTVGEKLLGEAFAGSVRGNIEPYSHKSERGWALMKHVSAEGRLEGELADAAVLSSYMGAAPWLEVGGGAGSFSALCVLRSGRFVADSAIELRSSAIRAVLLDYEVGGEGRLRWQVESTGPELEAALLADLRNYAIRRHGQPAPHLRGANLSVRARSRDLIFDGLLENLQLEVEIPDAEVPDLRFYNRYLPAASGLEIRAGSGRLHGRFRAEMPAARGEGEIALRTEGFEARFADLDLAGQLDLETRLRSEALAERVFDLTGTTARLHEVSLRDADGEARGEGWWADFTLLRGILNPAAPTYFDVDAEASLRDSFPLVALFGARRPLPAWARRAFSVEGVAATGTLRLGDAQLELDHFTAAGERLELQARLRFANGERRGALLATWGPLALGVQLDGARRSTRLVGARDWFAAYPALR